MDKTNYVKNNFWAKVKKNAGDVPFVKDAIALYYVMIDPLTPVHIIIIIAAALAKVQQYVSDHHYRNAENFCQSN